MKKKISILMALVVLSCSVLMGCSSEKLVPADQVVGALFQLAAMDDAAPMKDLLGFASEDDVRTALMVEGGSEMVEALEEQFTSAGIEFTTEEVEQMKDNIISLLKKTPYTVELTSEEKDKCVVTLKVNGYSMADMTEIAMTKQQEAQDALTPEQLQAIQSGDAEATQTFMHDYMIEYMNAVSQMSPMEEATEITVECEKLKVDVSGKEKVAWMPSNMTGFGNDIEAALMK